MKGPMVSHHNVSDTAYKALLKHMGEADGVTATKADDANATITGEETEICLTYDANNKSLRVDFKAVPEGLETYYWGHGLHRIHLFACKM